MPAPKTLPAKLARLDELLAQVDPGAAGSLRRGATAAKLAKLTKVMTVPDDVLAWFRWHDGQTRIAQLHPDDNHTPLSVDDALDARRFLGDPEQEIRQPWKPSWLPLLTNGAGDYICVETAGKGAGKLVTFRHDDSARPIAYANLGAWVDAAIAALAKAKPAKPPKTRLVLDGTGAKWTKLSKPPTEAQLAKRPVGTALSWKTVWPTLRGNEFRTYVFVKVLADGELPWRKARGDDERASIAKIQELAGQPKPPDDDFWKASDRSVAFDAKETNHDDTVDDPVPVTVYEAKVGVTG